MREEIAEWGKQKLFPNLGDYSTRCTNRCNVLLDIAEDPLFLKDFQAESLAPGRNHGHVKATCCRRRRKPPDRTKLYHPPLPVHRTHCRDFTNHVWEDGVLGLVQLIVLSWRSSGQRRMEVTITRQPLKPHVSMELPLWACRREGSQRTNSETHRCIPCSGATKTLRWTAQRRSSANGAYQGTKSPTPTFNI